MADRIEIAKKFYAQAKKMTLGMAASVFAYGAIGYYLTPIGKSGPAILNAQMYPLVKYGALFVSAAGIYGMWQLSNRSFHLFQAISQASGRSVQKIFLRTVIMNAGAELPLLLGMILVFLGHQPCDFIPFAVISLAGFVLAFPQKKQWSSWLGLKL